MNMSKKIEGTESDSDQKAQAGEASECGLTRQHNEQPERMKEDCHRHLPVLHKAHNTKESHVFIKLHKVT